ncbi:hypothetical protein CP533_6507 [Ophiocordyceps camponoti-saundersi (nom. inval.)]|nr:hypothetical protein CP533_6507 [Ophiocordyceps camponoti-saundersi (nom. inval.)]
MRLSTASTVLALIGAANAAASWSFSDASVTVKSITKKRVLAPSVPGVVLLGPKDTMKVSLTTLDDEAKAKRPGQALLIVKDSSGLEVPFPLTVKQSGKGTVQFSQRDLPTQLLLAKAPLQASLVLGSTGTTRGSVTPVFDFELTLDAASTTPSHEASLRYVQLPEILHTYRADPKSPPRIVSLAFALAVFASVPTILWLLFQANFWHATKAFSRAPLSHAVFFGSVVGMEFVFYRYHGGWNLFQTLPMAGLVGVSAFLSGTKALGEVQGRRMAGER